MAIIKINGTAIPNPYKYKIINSDLDSENTQRNTNGRLVRDRIRQGVYKLDLAWDLLTISQINQIATLTKPVKLNVEFFDPMRFTTTTATMYISDRSAEIVRTMKEDKPEETYWSLSLSLIEY